MYLIRHHLILSAYFSPRIITEVGKLYWIVTPFRCGSWPKLNKLDSAVCDHGCLNTSMWHRQCLPSGWDWTLLSSSCFTPQAVPAKPDLSVLECCKRPWVLCQPATGLVPLYGICSLSFSSGLIVFLIWSDSRVVWAHCSVSSLKADQGFKKIRSSASCFLTPAWLITFSKNKRNLWDWAGPESGSLALDQGRQQWLKWLPRQGFCKNLFKSLLVSREFFTWTVT